MTRRDIEFDAEGLTLRGRLYLPDGPQLPMPTVVMARGHSCVKQMFLDAYAKTFVAAGLGVLVYDNPENDGTLREEVDPWGQIRRYRHAITYACSLPEVDGSRIGIWGTCRSGGHVLVVRAIDDRVKCVVSQLPVISGYRDAHAIAEGRVPDVRPRCAGRQGAPGWKQQATLRSVETFREHETSASVDSAGLSPLLMIVQDIDALAAVDIYRRAPAPTKLVSFSGEDFDASVRDQEAAAGAARDWYLQHLSRPPGNPDVRPEVPTPDRAGPAGNREAHNNAGLR